MFKKIALLLLASLSTAQVYLQASEGDHKSSSRTPSKPTIQTFNESDGSTQPFGNSMSVTTYQPTPGSMAPMPLIISTVPAAQTDKKTAAAEGAAAAIKDAAETAERVRIATSVPLDELIKAEKELLSRSHQVESASWPARLNFAQRKKQLFTDPLEQIQSQPAQLTSQQEQQKEAQALKEATLQAKQQAIIAEAMYGSQRQRFVRDVAQGLILETGRAVIPLVVSDLYKQWKNRGKSSHDVAGQNPLGSFAARLQIQAQHEAILHTKATTLKTEGDVVVGLTALLPKTDPKLGAIVDAHANNVKAHFDQKKALQEATAKLAATAA